MRHVGDALAIIAALIDQAAVQVFAAQSGVVPVQSSAGTHTTLPAVLANRRPYSAIARAVQQEEEEEGGLADLAGLLPDDELRAAQAVAALQQFLRQPALSRYQPPSFEL
jgi:hypothetical protein